MTLPSSGPLSLNDIKGEFNGPGSPSLGDYYAGGSYVPPGTSGTYGAVPSSGPISIQNFYGTSATLQTISLTVGNSGIYYGYNNNFPFGSISPNTLSFAGNAFCDAIVSDGTYFYLSSTVGGISQSVFTTLNANGTPFASASASYTTDGVTYSSWQWTAANPLGTSGTVSCIFS
jgi:hypothetical protein